MKKKIISFIIFLLLFPALRFAEETGDVANSNADNSTQSTPQTNDNTLKLIPNPKLTIQIGIFSSGERVLNVINELKKNKISCRFQERKKFFYVYCGDFDRKRELKTARVLKNKIVSLGYRDAFVAFSNEIPRYSKPEILPKEKKPVDKKPLPEPPEEQPVKRPESVAEE
ncbi:MAG: SPOR domain-containing protein, partial [Candidatus Mariimomonas ferrooxydans]